MFLRRRCLSRVATALCLDLVAQATVWQPSLSPLLSEVIYQAYCAHSPQVLTSNTAHWQIFVPKRIGDTEQVDAEKSLYVSPGALNATTR